jgi:hypothetical protein
MWLLAALNKSDSLIMGHPLLWLKSAKAAQRF